MEPEGSIWCFLETDTFHCPKPDYSSSHPSCLREIFILCSRLHLGLPSCLVPPGFRTQNLLCLSLHPVGATYSVHLILRHVITYITFADQYKSLCNNWSAVTTITTTSLLLLLWSLPTQTGLPLLATNPAAGQDSYWTGISRMDNLTKNLVTWTNFPQVKRCFSKTSVVCLQRKFHLHGATVGPPAVSMATPHVRFIGR